VSTTGAIWSGNIAGNSGRLPDVSTIIFTSARIAAWLLVML
jgi:hypothetical protein